MPIYWLAMFIILSNWEIELILKNNMDLILRMDQLMYKNGKHAFAIMLNINILIILNRSYIMFVQIDGRFMVRK